MKFKATNIKYDTDGEHCPSLPKALFIEADSLQKAQLNGADIISDLTGWCVLSFNIRAYDFGKPSTPIAQQIQYLCRRSLNGQGVTNLFIKRLRINVRGYMGREGFRFLENHLDAKDGRWYASLDFSWPRLLLNSRGKQA
jgi:hypothetical protein